MLVDKVAKELYEIYCAEIKTFLQNNADYKEASELVAYGMKQIKDILPEDKLKLYLDLEGYISHKEFIFGREVYKEAFNQGAKMVMEIVMNSSSKDKEV
jgi:hypothetical protein